MDPVADQYEVFPYPARDPADEKKRLLLGSPSSPVEIDHFLFGGRRDWSQTLRILVAGGGTGDALIQLAQLLKTAGKPHEITYLDLSTSSRKIAEARAKVRGLTGIRFVTGSLLEAPDLGLFDYIDCCGVLHHLPDPDAGFAALRQALAPGGGIGLMVYAPLGRSGVYPLQDGFNALFGDLPPQEKLTAARALFDKVPDSHPFKTNPRLIDHKDSDAGFFDLLLHSQDRAYSVADLLGALERADLQLVSFLQSNLYDLSRLTDLAPDMDANQAMAVTEKLRGTMKVHICYVTSAGAKPPMADGRQMNLIPHLSGMQAVRLAQGISKGARPNLTIAGEKMQLDLPRNTAPLIAGINGRRSLAEIAKVQRLDPIQFAPLWQKIHSELSGWGALFYSNFMK